MDPSNRRTASSFALPFSSLPPCLPVPHGSKKLKPISPSFSIIEEEPVNCESDEANSVPRKVSPSFAESVPAPGAHSKSLSQYNRTTLERGIVSIAECPTLDSSGLNVSVIKRSMAEGTAEFAGSMFSEGFKQMLNDINVENIRSTEDESAQKPAALCIPAGFNFNSLPETGSKRKSRSKSDELPDSDSDSEAPQENVSSTPVAAVRINPRVFPSAYEDKLKLSDTRKMVKGYLGSILSRESVAGKQRKKPREVTGRKEGYLEKLSNGLIYSWKAKYCCLKNTVFFFYRNVETGRLSGCIDFSRVPSDFRIDLTLLTFTIRIWWKQGTKAFTFRARTSQELEDWGCELSTCIDQSSGKDWIHVVPELTRFWKFPLIPEQAFRKKADTGDILLFSGKRFVCGVQRFLTRSRFDHVAMLLRYDNGKLYVLESTNGDGVGVCEWNDRNMHDYQDGYSRVVFRHLKCKRNLESITKLQAFLNKARGKKYQLTPWRLLQWYSSTGSVENMRENKTFFCSELIAACLKVMGYLPKHICCAQYWPGTFSSDTDLRLLNGAKFEEELQIDIGPKAAVWEHRRDKGQEKPKDLC